MQQRISYYFYTAAILGAASAYFYSKTCTQSSTSSVSCSESIKRRVSVAVSYPNRHSQSCRTAYRLPLIQTCLPYQKVSDIKVIPEPDRLESDKWGNKFAVYDVRKTAPGQSFEVKQSAEIETSSAVYIIESGDLDKDDKNTSYAPAVKAEEDEAKLLAALGDQASADYEKTYFKLLGTYDFIRKNFDFESSARSRSFKDMLETRTLQCADAAILCTKLAQQLGISSRTANGFLLNNENASDYLSHSWSEAYIPQKGFVPADPTQGRYPYTRQMFFAKYNPGLIMWYLGNEPLCQMTEYDLPDEPSADPALKIEHSIIEYKTNISEKQLPWSVLPAPDFDKTLLMREKQLQPLAPEGMLQFNGPQALRCCINFPSELRYAQYLAMAAWDEDSLKKLEDLHTEQAELIKVWRAVFSQDWEKAERLLKDAGRSSYWAEANLAYSVFTVQYKQACLSCADLNGHTLSPLTAEIMLQLWEDTRQWKLQQRYAQCFTELYPDEPQFILKAHRAAFKSQDWQSTEKYINLWKQKFPEDGYIYLTSAQLYLEFGRIKESLDMLEKAMSLNLSAEELQFCRNLSETLKDSIKKKKAFRSKSEGRSRKY